MRNRLLGGLLVLLALALSLSLPAQTPPARTPLVIVAELQGAVSPASAEYLQRALGEARQRQAALLVFRIDTPGGLDTSMREMIQAILASPVPVAVFVAPGGARAASAGTYLIYAAHVAAMAPGTNLGAATPVQIGLGGERGRPAETGDAADKKADEKADGKSPGDKDRDGSGKRTTGDRAADASGKGSTRKTAPPVDVSAAKATHDAAAYLRSLAQLRGRNAEWAEQAVRESVSLAAQEALARGVVDLLANDVPDLLAKIDGRKVALPDGEHRLALKGAVTEQIERNWKERVLARIADPNMALILMMLGIYGLLFEFYSPGMAAPGVIGGICLLLGLYGLALLPVNFAGVALLLLGIALMVGEAFLPSFGIVGIGGVIAFVAGAMMLIDADVPGFTVAWHVVVPLAAVSGGLILAIAGFALRSRRRPAVAGREAMIGAPVVAIDAFAGDGAEGWVTAWGERWRARSQTPLAPGARGRVLGIEGLTLIVRADNEEEGEQS